MTPEGGNIDYKLGEYDEYIELNEDELNRKAMILEAILDEMHPTDEDMSKEQIEEIAIKRTSTLLKYNFVAIPAEDLEKRWIKLHGSLPY